MRLWITCKSMFSGKTEKIVTFTAQPVAPFSFLHDSILQVNNFTAQWDHLTVRRTKTQSWLVPHGHWLNINVWQFFRLWERISSACSGTLFNGERGKCRAICQHQPAADVTDGWCYWVLMDRMCGSVELSVHQHQSHAASLCCCSTMIIKRDRQSLPFFYLSPSASFT